MRIHLLALVAVACNSSSSSPKPEKLDAAALHHQLSTADGARRIEKIRIFPDHAKARYDITWKDQAKHAEAEAAFPGTFTDEMVDAGVPYTVGAPEEGVRSISMTELRTVLRCGAHSPRCDEATTITAIRIVKLDERARYEVTRRGGKTEIAYGEYPGRVVDELRAAGIAFTESQSP